MFKGLGNLASMLKQAQQLSGRMKGLSDELRGKRVVGSAGGGLVEVEANGMAEILKCRIDPSLVEQNDRELLEDLVAAAANLALSKAKELHAESLRSLAGGMQLPPELEQALGELTDENAGPRD